MKKFLAIFCLVFMLTGCEAVIKEVPQESVGKNVVDTTTSTQEPIKEYEIGQTVQGGNIQFTVNSIRDDKGKDFLKPEDKHVFFYIDITAENVGSKAESISSLMMFKLYDSEGYAIDTSFTANTKGSLDGDIQPGKKIRGELGFEIPEDSKEFELHISPAVFDSTNIVYKIIRE